MRATSKIATLAGLLIGSSARLMANPAPQPPVDISPGTASTMNADWQGVADRTYFFQCSFDLQSWMYAPFMEFSTGTHQYGFSSTAPKAFVRLKYVDTNAVTTLLEAQHSDFDGDGYSNDFELTVLFTDPLNRDSDNDGILDGADSNDGDSFPDAWEIEYFGNLTTLTAADADDDLDGDGISNAFEAQMRTDPNADQSASGSTRESYFYTSTGRLDTATGDKPMSFVFDDEGNLESAQ